jgi:hypothetical protein
MECGDDAKDRPMTPDIECEVCHAPLLESGRRWSGCAACDRAVDRYNAKIDQAGDSNYVYHELAHHIVLFRRVPRRAIDWQRIERAIDPMTIGRAQVHELRTLALQFVAYEHLGWQPRVNELVELSWFGLVEAKERNGGRSLVETRQDAKARISAFVPKTSARNVRMYVNALKELRG